MIYLVEETGRVTQRINAPNEHSPHYKADGVRVVVSDDAHDNSCVYYDDNSFVAIPEAPSEFHSWNWADKAWQADADLAKSSVRTKRDSLLTASDWTQLPDVPLETKATWAAYRQALRDLTDQAGFPFSIVWPTAPTQQ